MSFRIPTGVRLRFGLAFDGAFETLHAIDGGASMGVRRVGPQGLLEELERSLGLPTVTLPRSERVSRYAAALSAALAGTGPATGEAPSQPSEVSGPAQADSSRAPFYAASYRLAPRRVAARLLRERDELVLSGWTPSPETGQPPRLADLARVEGALDPDDLGGLADRWRRVMQALEALAPPPAAVPGISRITSVDPLELLPAPWRSLLERLRELGTPVEHAPTPPAPSRRGGGAPAGTDLQRLAAILAAAAGVGGAAGAGAGKAGAAAGGTSLTGDGSVRLVTGGSHLEHAALLARLAEADGTKTIIAPRGAAAISEAFHAHGLPRPAASGGAAPGGGTAGGASGGPSPLFGLLRLLPAFLWEPLDPERVAEFLWIRPNPLGAAARGTLLRQIRERPGFGSPEWREALGSLEEKDRRRVDTFLERRRFSPEEGVPGAEAAELFRVLERWARRRLHAGREAKPAGHATARPEGIPADVWVALAGAAGELAAQLEEREETALSPTELADLVAEILPATAAPGAQAGAIAMVAEPAAADGPIGRLLWAPWTTGAEPRTRVFTRDEREWLAARGVELTDPALLRRRELYHSGRVLRESDGVDLFLPDTLDGEALRSHPAHALLSALADPEVLSVPVDGAESRLPFETLRPAELPRPRERWELPAGDRLEFPTSVSFSAAQDLIQLPHRWVLHAAAGLRPSKLYRLPRGNHLYGNVVHELARQWFKRGNAVTATPEEFVEWYREAFPAVIREHGASLLQLGAEAELRRLRDLSHGSLERLRASCREQGWTVSGVEENVNARLGEIPLHGRADLLLRRKDHVAVIDLKWSGRGRREEEIREGRPYQLAFYARAAAEDMDTAHAGYFIVDAELLVSTDAAIFPDAAVVEPPAEGPDQDPGLAKVVATMTAALRGRKDELTRGVVTLPARAEVPDYDEYLSFLGWES